MIDTIRTLDIMRQLGPGGPSAFSGTQSKRDELTYELQKHLNVMGPTPKRCLETLTDLGLSDPEIARYFNIPTRIIAELRQVWRIGGGN